ncbi:hypothetical protein DPMN_040617 [Dreissena polymorpha]|uniref:Uncharacterized protein n=1 Tax=Dreissena polymorpha TaxID=45954 RepID=A0A9D4CVP6_DREPO|nr:hypothetical protein DPMN_040617 [Dreissena polymorpha]
MFGFVFEKNNIRHASWKIKSQTGPMCRRCQVILDLLGKKFQNLLYTNPTGNTLSLSAQCLCYKRKNKNAVQKEIFLSIPLADVAMPTICD